MRYHPAVARRARVTSEPQRGAVRRADLTHLRVTGTSPAGYRLGIMTY
jgi:hypothetical protein